MSEKHPALDKHWHLGKSEGELITADFEYALMRCIESFNGWQQECLAAVAGHKVSATDNVVLHVTRMNDRPKSVTEIAKLMNRSDLSNLKYSIRKLVDAGLLKKVSEGGKRKGMRYQATEAGISLTEAYAELREEQLMPQISAISGHQEMQDQATRALNLLSGIYDQAAHIIAFHRGPTEEDSLE